MSNVETVSGTGIPLLLDDIDTDRIIPARFLRCVTFDGIGEHAFEDDREQDPKHPFNQKRFQNGSILVSRRNFGCGSSREHAPQSLMRWGVKAIVAESFAEIFFGNCTSLGIPAVCASRSDLRKLAAAIEADPTLEFTLDLNTSTLSFGGETVSVTMPDSARSALTSGQFDALAQLLARKDDIAATASKLPYLNGFAVS
ncbi:MAG: 3-isopropylmalate dehydratase small subunit [Planctomycetota bacterium]|nr:3-isopropylmalate dehydratase small subunit [Planctomycetota bacterium]MDA1158637.1 3-isopropylmalate dehydratase small subunit [Planctomycetota bacterium]